MERMFYERWELWLVMGGVALLVWGLLHAQLWRKRYREVQRLKKLSQSKGRIFKRLVWEFETPLNVISAAVEAMEQSPGGIRPEDLALIRQNCEHLLHLNEQVMELDMLEADKQKPRPTQSDIIPFLHYVVASFQEWADEKKIGLHFLPEDESMIMDFDEGFLQEVLIQLLSNALKYSAEGTHIYFRQQRISSRGPSLQLIIQDQGQGIAEEHLPHVFEPFYQIPTPENEIWSGRGLGLSLTRSLIEAMGGSVSIKSRVGQGTSIYLNFPISRQAPPAAPYPEHSPATVWNRAFSSPDDLAEIKQEGHHQILIMVANSDIAAYLQRALEPVYDLIFCSNGVNCLDRTFKEIPDLVVIDMPDGAGLCRQLKNDRRSCHIPIILLTRNLAFLPSSRPLEAGADVYLPKPFRREELLVRIREQLQLREVMHHQYQDAGYPMEPRLSRPHRKDPFLQKLQEVIEKHLGEDDFSLQAICQELGVSHSQLSRKLKALLNLSPSQYLRYYRLNRARELLRKSPLNISEIAYEVGFKDPAYFSRSFKELFGQPPSHVRN